MNGLKTVLDVSVLRCQVIFFFFTSFQIPALKKVLDGYENQRDNYKRQKGSKYHPARSCRDLQLDSDVIAKSGEFNDC